MHNIILGVDIHQEAYKLDRLDAPEFFNRLS